MLRCEFRTILLLVAFLPFPAWVSRAQVTTARIEYPITITGSVQKIERETSYPNTSSETERLIFYLRLQLENVSETPVILIKSHIQGYDPIFASDSRFENLVAKIKSARTSYFLKRLIG